MLHIDLKFYILEVFKPVRIQSCYWVTLLKSVLSLNSSCAKLLHVVCHFKIDYNCSCINSWSSSAQIFILFYIIFLSFSSIIPVIRFCKLYISNQCITLLIQPDKFMAFMLIMVKVANVFFRDVIKLIMSCQ